MGLTVGTAGHIDHGKTWLVRALTGKDTDRLPEERARGISIDLGYAPLELPDGRVLSLVDVPGHERFVRTMVAGATGIDLFLLVIDAGEGARPQTHEHLAILRLLGIERGVVAVTKADAVDEETLELAVAEAEELVPEAEVVAVSAKTGAGLDELRARTRPRGRLVAQSHSRRPDAALRRPRVHAARDRHGRHRDALVRLDRRRRRAAGRARRLATCASAASRCTTRTVERAEAGQRVARQPAGRRARTSCVAATRSSTPDAFPLATGSTSARGARRRSRAARHAPPRHDPDPGTRRPRRRALRAAAARRAGRRGARRPRRAAARHDRRRRRRARPGAAAAASTPSGWRCSAEPGDDRAALVHEPVRRRGRSSVRGARDRVARPSGRLGVRAGVARRCSVEELRRRIAEAIPLDPGVPAPPEPWADAIVPLLGLERRGAKLYLPGATAALGEAATRRARGASSRRPGSSP